MLTSPTVGSVWMSPLRKIERSAEEQAKAANLDMSTPGAVERLHGLLVDAVGRWRDEYRKGQRPLDIADPEAAVERALRNLTGYGPLAAPRGSRCLGNYGQRTECHFHEKTLWRRGIPPRGLPR